MWISRERCRKELRQLMLDRVEQLDPARKATVALSGGIDSVTILFAMLASGRKPRCYTFYMDGFKSDDLVSSQRITSHFGLEHVLVPVTTNHDQIVADVRKLLTIQQAPKIKKTVIQCMHPWLYVCPEMQSRGDDHILIGFSAGNIFCLSRRDTKARMKLGEDGFLKAGWREHRFTDLRFVDANVAYLCKRYGIVMDDFFAADPIFDWHKPWTIDEINRAEDGSRLEKATFLYAFEDYFKAGGGFARKPASYQVNSRLRDFHDGLLWNPKYNPGATASGMGKHKSIIAIYNRIAKGEI